MNASDDDESSSDADPAEDGHDEDRIVLRASAGRWVWVLIGSMIFVAFGVGMALGTGTGAVAQGIGWCLVALFGFCAVVALRQLVSPGSLIVSREAIEMIRRGRLTTFAFADCGAFTTWRNPSRGSTSVVFDYAPDYAPGANVALARANRELMGGSRTFADPYGLSPQALADLLNDVRDASHRTP